MEPLGLTGDLALVILKVTFAVWNLSVSLTSANTACIICDMFTNESESARGL